MSDRDVAAAETAEQDTRRLANDLCIAGHDLDVREASACQECYDIANAVMDTPWLAAHDADLRERVAQALAELPIGSWGRRHEGDQIVADAQRIARTEGTD